MKALVTKSPKIVALLVFFTCLGLVCWGIFKSEPVQQVFSHSDKFAHLVAFFCLAITGRVALSFVNAYVYWGTALLLAFVMEYAQGVLQLSRVTSFNDALANAIGVLLALCLLKVINRNTHSC